MKRVKKYLNIDTNIHVNVDIDIDVNVNINTTIDINITININMNISMNIVTNIDIDTNMIDGYSIFILKLILILISIFLIRFERLQRFVS